MIPRMGWFAVAGFSAALGGACAPRGTTPHEMSVAGHEAAARREEGAAMTHRALYDPSIAESYQRCAGGPAGARLPSYDLNCWTALRNPTADHVRMAEQHRKLAVLHRAAAEALREAEARACVGVSEYDRDVSPFSHREDIAAVAPVTGRVGGGRAGPVVEKVYGARVTFHDVPGLTLGRLQTIVDCHLARNAALGHDVPEMPYCPLVLKGVTAKVQQTDSGRLAVEVRSDDFATAQEIWRRANQLTRPQQLSARTGRPL